MQDDDILIILRSKKREKGLVQLYRYLPKVETLIRTNGGTRADAQDIFQEALIVLLQKIQSPQFILTAGIDTYLYSVCRLLWSNELRKRNKQPISGLSDNFDSPEMDTAYTGEQENRLLQAEAVLKQLGKRCQQLLLLFYYRALSMKAIARDMGFSSENVAKNQKYKCLEQAKLKLKAQLA